MHGFIIDAGAIKPGLRAFGPVFLGIGAGVGVVVEMLVRGVAVGGLPALAPIAIGLGCVAGDGVGEFVQGDVFAAVGVGLQIEEIFFGAGGQRAPAEAAGAAILIGPGRGGHVLGVLVFRNVHGVFHAGNNADFHAATDESRGHPGGAVLEHMVNGIGTFQEGVIGDFFRTDDRHAADGECFFVKGLMRNWAEFVGDRLDVDRIGLGHFAVGVGFRRRHRYACVVVTPMCLGRVAGAVVVDWPSAGRTVPAANPPTNNAAHNRRCMKAP